MKCRVCDGLNLALVLDLGVQPWGNHFLKPEEVGHEPRYPLRVMFCETCGTAQLDYTVPKEVMFTDHTYVSGTTATLRQHFAETARYVDETFFRTQRQKSVLDIGSNDGTQLAEYRAFGYDVLGVESCARIAQQANAQGLNTIVEFFNDGLAKRIGRKFDVINASGVFFHLEELHSVCEGIRECLSEDGVFVAQFLYMKNIADNDAFDQIYHEHLLYYNLQTVEVLLNKHGLESFDAYGSPIHGGSMILLATHRGRKPVSDRLLTLRGEENVAGANTKRFYEEFADRAQKNRDRILAFVSTAKASGKTIFGLGAPVKGNTLLNYCGIGTQYLDCLVERNPMRAGLFSPGMHIPIVLEHELKRLPDTYFVLAWNFKREILERYADLVRRGVEFFFPVNPRGG